jgi:hypothetical protein
VYFYIHYCPSGYLEHPNNNLGHLSLNSPDNFDYGPTPTIIVISRGVPYRAPIEHLGHDHHSVYLLKVNHPYSLSQGC